MRVVIISLLAVSFLFSACQTPEQKKEKLKQAALKKKTPDALRFEAPDVIKRVESDGDLFAPVQKLKQKLPKLQ